MRLGVCALLVACGGRQGSAAHGASHSASDSASDSEGRAADHASGMKKTQRTADAHLGTRAPGTGLDLGTPAPTASVRDLEGKRVPLEEIWRDGPALLVFYRGGWCPYCNWQLHQLSETYDAFVSRGLSIAAISVDRVANAAALAEARSLPFPVFSDAKLAAHRAFRVVHELDSDTVAKLQGYGIDVQAASGEAHQSIAVPAVFIIGRLAGAPPAVHFVHSDNDYATRPDPDQLLDLFDRLSIDKP